MKHATTRVGDGRGQMRERQRRDRAAVQPLRVRYPKLASLRLEFDFSDRGQFTPVPQVMVLHPPAAAYFVFPCPYTDCDGEFDLAPAVAGLVGGGHTHGEGQMRCTGARARSDGTREPCDLLLEYSLHAQLAEPVAAKR